MDVDKEFRTANWNIFLLIEQRTRAALSRIDHMYAVGSGICHCGSDVDTHGWGDNHSPVEMMMDKSYGPE